jgi:hypothetical protein
MNTNVIENALKILKTKNPKFEKKYADQNVNTYNEPK